MVRQRWWEGASEMKHYGIWYAWPEEGPSAGRWARFNDVIFWTTSYEVAKAQMLAMCVDRNGELYPDTSVKEFPTQEQQP